MTPVQTPAAAALAPVLEFVTGHAGLHLAGFQAAGAAVRITSNMALLGITEPTAYVRRLETDGMALDDLIADLTVGESYFFRDPGIFLYLRTQFLPRMKRTLPEGQALRVWSAGCASGEEAYSVAMLLEDEGWGGRSVVMGTDISRVALAKARAGTYGEWSFRGGDRSFMRRYFTSQGSTFAIAPGVRDLVRFQYHNLALDGPPTLVVGTFGVDLIMCRNVLMYLDQNVVGRVAGRFHDALMGGGVLLTGAADPPLQSLCPFSSELFDEGTVYWRHAVALEPADGRTERRTEVSGAASAPEGAREPRASDAGTWADGIDRRKPEDAASFALRVRRMATTAGPAAAAAEADRGLTLFPLSVDIAFLLAILPSIVGNYARAADAARRALYLDRFQPALHFLLATSLWNCGDLVGARRGFRNARDLAAALPQAQIVMFTEGETAGRLAAGASAHLAMVEAESGIRA